MDEVKEIKEDIKENVEKHATFIAAALYLCGCVSMLWKRKEEETKEEETKEEETKEEETALKSDTKA